MHRSGGAPVPQARGYHSPLCSTSLSNKKQRRGIIGGPGRRRCRWWRRPFGSGGHHMSRCASHKCDLPARASGARAGRIAHACCRVWARSPPHSRMFERRQFQLPGECLRGQRNSKRKRRAAVLRTALADDVLTDPPVVDLVGSPHASSERGHLPRQVSIAFRAGCQDARECQFRACHPPTEQNPNAHNGEARQVEAVDFEED